MSLPGKYCIGILEEDNPLKSYFRFKPILIAKDGRFAPFDSPNEYPADGCIRIVPDKNESSLFKSRMRRIGLFAVVNLFDHPNENDKIRANKNYRSDETERNAYIIYSDVVREPDPEMLYTVLKIDPETAANAEIPAQPLPNALLRPNGTLLGRVWHCTADANGYRLEETDEEINASEMQAFDLTLPEGQAMTLAVRPLRAIEPPKPEPVQEAPKEKTPENSSNKISHEEIEAAAPAYSRFLAEQCGLNPRRGRSLKEIVDDKWRASRLEALGTPTPSVQNTNPTETPIESALSAMRAVWSHPEQRAALVAALAEFENLDSALNVCRNAAHESLINKQLVDLEAQRLEALKGLEDLRKRRIDIREELKQEILESEAEAFADAIEKTRAARIQQSEAEKTAVEMQSAAESAQDLLNSLNDGRFEKRLHEFALTSRAAALIRHLDGKRTLPAIVNGCSTDRETLICRVLTAFEQAGAPILRTDAIHLLICASQSPILLFTGAPGCGKTRAARLLARALGLPEARLRLVAPGKDPISLPDAPGSAMRMVILDDANLSPAGDLYRGLAADAESERILLCATLQDDGLPIPAYAFDRAFAIRLPSESTIENWSPTKRVTPEINPPVSLSTLRAAFPIQANAIPEPIFARLNRLIADCALIGVRPSRRALNAVLSYLSAAIPLMEIAPLSLLDQAIAERILPAILAGAPMNALRALPNLFSDLPKCTALLAEPLPVNW